MLLLEHTFSERPLKTDLFDDGCDNEWKISKVTSLKPPWALSSGFSSSLICFKTGHQLKISTVDKERLVQGRSRSGRRGETPVEKSFYNRALKMASEGTPDRKRGRRLGSAFQLLKRRRKKKLANPDNDSQPVCARACVCV